MSDPTQELAAIRKITAALKPLDLAAQQRVIRYLLDLYGLNERRENITSEPPWNAPIGNAPA